MTMLTTPFSSQTNREDESRFYPNETRSDAARSDAAIEEAIWNDILKDRSLGPKYQKNLSVEVEHGRVKLLGHVLKPWHSPLIADIAHRIKGVV